MRLFQNLEEAASEIKRDLAKSPSVYTTRVQNIQANATVHEALDYSYCVTDMPEWAEGLLELGVKLGFWKDSETNEMHKWLIAEAYGRTHWMPSRITELMHPHLMKLERDWEPDYTYTDRLRGSIESAKTTLAEDNDSRRAFIPIFHPTDVERASRRTRIPCSIGYQPLIRYVGDSAFLHLTYMERACDFDKFWLTDIWLARQWQRTLLANLQGYIDDELHLGHTTHFITSLHSFITEEIY